MPIYATVIFLGSFLLFEVQPVIARFVLPWFGGSAAVWTTCMLFFQTALVLGYLQSYLTHRFLRPRAQAWLHAALLGATLLLSPIVPEPAWRPSGGEEPTLRILALLVRTVGLPYVLLATTGPLLQSWFVAEHPGRSPYRLFALSNLGSMLALLSYPLVVEPRLSSPEQARLWSWAFAAYAVLAIAVALRSTRNAAHATGGNSRPNDHSVGSEEVTPALGVSSPTTSIAGAWIFLPACASTLLLAITNHLTQDVAAIPLLWIVPLCIYLTTFILCFDQPRLYRRRVFLPLGCVLFVAMAYLRLPDADKPELWLQIAVFSTGLFVACMCCHGELARLRPHPRSLTSYYLLIAIGGALGGLGVGVAAPLLLSSSSELELAIVVTALAVAMSLLLDGKVRGLASERVWIPIVATSYIVGLGVLCIIAVGDAMHDVTFAGRNFYGALRVVLAGDLGNVDARKRLLHGNINHGGQWLHPDRARRPTTYYCEDSGAGLALLHHHLDRPRRLGVVGLGTGTLAAYARAADTLRYYEINPLIVQVARTEFTQLSSSGAQIEIALGDARISLEREQPENFDVLAIDAFSGDAIPVHLLTREAFALYFRHLQPGGILAVHISNRHVDLKPVVADAAHAAGRMALLIETDRDDDRYCFATSWILVGRPESLADPSFLVGEPLSPAPDFRPWTDVYSNLISVMH